MPLLFWLPAIVITEMWSMALTETPIGTEDHPAQLFPW
jgi:hypothetical protein